MSEDVAEASVKRNAQKVIRDLRLDEERDAAKRLEQILVHHTREVIEEMTRFMSGDNLDVTASNAIVKRIARQTIPHTLETAAGEYWADGDSA